MSDTPMTDKRAFNPTTLLWPVVHEAVPADFVRELERELAAAIKERDEARQEICEFVAESDEASTGMTTTAKQIAAMRKENTNG